MNVNGYKLIEQKHKKEIYCKYRNEERERGEIKMAHAAMRQSAF